jgi:hypothetical protein
MKSGDLLMLGLVAVGGYLLYQWLNTSTAAVSQSASSTPTPVQTAVPEKQQASPVSASPITQAASPIQSASATSPSAWTVQQGSAAAPVITAVGTPQLQNPVQETIGGATVIQPLSIAEILDNQQTETGISPAEQEDRINQASFSLATMPITATWYNGAINVTGPPGATVIIEGVETNLGLIGSQGTLVYPITLAPGNYTLWITPDGRSGQNVPFTVPAGISGINRIPVHLIHRGRYA